MNKRHASVFILLPTVLGIAGAMTINKYNAVGALSVALATVLTYLVPIKSPGLLVKHKPSVMGSTLSLYASMAVLLVRTDRGRLARPARQLPPIQIRAVCIHIQ